MWYFFSPEVNLFGVGDSRVLVEGGDCRGTIKCGLMFCVGSVYVKDVDIFGSILADAVDYLEAGPIFKECRAYGPSTVLQVGSIFEGGLIGSRQIVATRGAKILGASLRGDIFGFDDGNTVVTIGPDSIVRFGSESGERNLTVLITEPGRSAYDAPILEIPVLDEHDQMTPYYLRVTIDNRVPSDLMSPDAPAPNGVVSLSLPIKLQDGKIDRSTLKQLRDLLELQGLSPIFGLVNENGQKISPPLD